MIKVIIFDLGGVLFTNGTKKFVDTLSYKYHLEKQKIIEIMDGEIGSLYREAKLSRDEFWKRLVEELQIEADVDKLEDEWINGYDLIEGTRDLIQELSKTYKIYYLSDNVKERIEKIHKKFNFLNWFEDGVFSHEVGARKPNVEVYRFALEKIGVKPNEAVFIDDKAHFLIPAKKMGMLTFLFVSPEKLRSAFKEHKILR